MFYLALLSLAAMQDYPQQSDDRVVVTGQSLANNQRLLDECLSRGCSVEQDGNAALAHAENQFVAGNYKDALSTLGSALGRHRRHAREFPVIVSDLTRARARVAAHLGFETLERSESVNTLAALKAGLPDNDPKVIAAYTELGDFNARSGDVRGAEQRYRQATRAAVDANLPNLEGFALLRLANLYVAAASGEPRYRSAADQSLADIASSTKPEHLPFARAARILVALDATRSGGDAEVEKLIEEIRSQGGTARPMLIHSPAIDLTHMTQRTPLRGNVLSRIAVDNFDGQWIDVGFRITANGKVADVEILRQGEETSGRWIEPVRQAIAARRYAPMNSDPLDPGLFRVERFTLTSRWTMNSGSRFKVRDGRPRIETLDLSTDRSAEIKS